MSLLRSQEECFADRIVRITHHASRVTFICLLLSACSPASQEFSTEFLAMGTTVSITVETPTSVAAQQAIKDARREIERIGHEWYPWSKDGELKQLNAALAEGKTAAVSTELAQLLKRSQEYVRLSDGAFDPAIGGLVQMWGLNAITERAALTIPSQSQLTRWQQNHPTLADLHIDAQIGTTISSTRRDVLIDLGAIGKGYAVDRTIEILRQHGIHEAFVNAGGNARAIGTHEGRGWHLSVRDPRAVRSLAALELQGDESISTSGDYERFVIADGKRLHHLLDPRTGRPTEHTRAVTVIAKDATTADAASTAIFVAGPEHWQKTARALGIDEVLRVDASGAVQISRKLQTRLQSSNKITPTSEARQTTWVVVDL